MHHLAMEIIADVFYEETFQAYVRSYQIDRDVVEITEKPRVVAVSRNQTHRRKTSQHTYDTNTISLGTAPREIQMVPTLPTISGPCPHARSACMVLEHNGHNTHADSD
jgi:hypothetical protein